MFYAIRSIASAASLLALLAGAQAQPAASPPGQKPDIKANLVIGSVDAHDPQYAWMAVRIALGAGWKTYWKSPGDAGLPPEFDWSQSSNVKSSAVEWPAPRRMSILGIETVGYTHEVVFPVRVQRNDPGLETSIRLKLTIYACSTICVREERDLSATIEPAPRNEASQSAIDVWRAKVPRSTSDALTVTSIERLNATPPQLRINVASARPFGELDAFVESDPPISGDRPEVTFGANGNASLTVTFPGQAADALRAQSLAATVLAGDNSVIAVSPAETSGRTSDAGTLRKSVAQTGTSGDVEPTSLWTLLATAVIGGLILNLMPCVFPVLSLKLLSFVREDTIDRTQVRIGFTATAAGVVASFLVLATALAALKAAGTTIGWGIQFQQPIFLGGMAIVVSLFAANLLGLFHFALPSALMNGLTRKAQGTSVTSQFATGFVATLLATPCSAPFVGTAVGFALARGTSEIYLIFAALGIGMASPYLLVAAIPKLAMLLPRPGRWIVLVKKLMAATLLATTAWLLFVLSNVAGTTVAMMTGAAITLALLVLHSLKGPSRNAWAFRGAAVAGLAILILAAVFGGGHTAASEDIPWRRFSKEEIRSLVGSGRTVFVDITADWCVVCKVNKAFVIEGPEIARRLASDIVPLQGDWTRPNEDIARFMKENGRYGLPFNMVFGPGAPDGIVLPELLSKAMLTAAFDKALSKSTTLTTGK